MKKVLVLGSDTGLGRMICLVLSQSDGISVSATYGGSSDIQNSLPDNITESVLRTDCSSSELSDNLSTLLKDSDYVVNCLSEWVPVTGDTSEESEDYALSVARSHIMTPFIVAQVAEEMSCKVVHPSSHGVFSGGGGKYTEKRAHDSDSVFGRACSMGEAISEHVYNLRCCIVGPEPRTKNHFLSRLINLPANSKARASKDRLLTPCTSLAFARICRGIILQDRDIGNVQHISTNERLSLFDMMVSTLAIFRREDVQPLEKRDDPVMDWSLATVNEEVNGELWDGAGYDSIPSFEDMLSELREFLKINERFLSCTSQDKEIKSLAGDQGIEDIC